MRPFLIVLLSICCSCASSERVRDGASISETQLRRLVLGHWYLASGMPHPEKLPGYWQELDYRGDGSCTKTTVVVGIDPRTNTQRVVSRSDLPGVWTLSGDVISHRWKGQRPNDELRVLHISSQHLDLEYLPLHSWQTYSRKFDEKI